MSVKIGDVVKYRAFGREVNAIVLRINTSTPTHLGENDEPALTLAFIDPERERAIAPRKNTSVLLPETALPIVYIEHDIVHVSHEFDADFLKKHGNTPAQILSQRGHAEWEEIEPIVAADETVDADGDADEDPLPPAA